MPATSSPSDRPDLQAFGPAARRAVDAAEHEARALGHGRVGTEHLLLGVLADGGRAADVLAAAGATGAAVRHKVREAGPPPSQLDPGPLALSERAARALGRSVRFSHRRRTERVTPEDLLIGVLDVEGTAGQVLRSLGVDVDALPDALDGGLDAPSEPTTDRPAPSGRATCPSCGGAVESLRYRLVRAEGPDGPRDALVLTCAACGAVLGAAPA